jgi:hypothetical protein
MVIVKVIVNGQWSMVNVKVKGQGQCQSTADDTVQPLGDNPFQLVYFVELLQGEA